jgi:hypothetical protein
MVRSQLGLIVKVSTFSRLVEAPDGDGCSLSHFRAPASKCVEESGKEICSHELVVAQKTAAV